MAPSLCRITTWRDTEESSTERQARLELSWQCEASFWHALDAPSQPVLSHAPNCYFGKIRKVVPPGFHLVIPIRHHSSHWHCCYNIGKILKSLPGYVFLIMVLSISAFQFVDTALCLLTQLQAHPGQTACSNPCIKPVIDRIKIQLRTPIALFQWEFHNPLKK